MLGRGPRQLGAGESGDDGGEAGRGLRGDALEGDAWQGTSYGGRGESNDRVGGKGAAHCRPAPCNVHQQYGAQCLNGAHGHVLLHTEASV